MASNVSYEQINENYPITGEDNDTQVFRDNFNTIKNSLRIAKEEIGGLLDNAAQGVSWDSEEKTNDFNNNIIQNAVLRNTSLEIDDGGTTSTPIEVDYTISSYQIFRIAANITIKFVNLPNSQTTPRSVGKITLELYSDGLQRTVAFISDNGTVFKKSPGFPEIVVLNEDEEGGGIGNPVIIEVWAHSSDKIFLNYLGKFSS